MIRPALLFFALILSQVQPPPAAAETLAWNMRNDYPYIVYVRFFSERYKRAWPGGNDSYIFDDGQDKTVTLSCERGEKICFGAFTKTRQGSWGVGEYGQQTCESCCRVCGDSYTTTDVLN